MPHTKEGAPQTMEEVKAQPKWIIAKEIFVGSVPLILAILTFGGLLYGNQRAMEVRIDQLEKADVAQQTNTIMQRSELLAALGKLGTQMGSLEVAVARLSARSDDNTPRRVQNMPVESFPERRTR